MKIKMKKQYIKKNSQSIFLLWYLLHYKKEFIKYESTNGVRDDLKGKGFELTDKYICFDDFMFSYSNSEILSCMEFLFHEVDVINDFFILSYRYDIDDTFILDMVKQFTADKSKNLFHRLLPADYKYDDKWLKFSINFDIRKAQKLINMYLKAWKEDRIFHKRYDETNGALLRKEKQLELFITPIYKNLQNVSPNKYSIKLNFDNWAIDSVGVLLFLEKIKDIVITEISTISNNGSYQQVLIVDFTKKFFKDFKLNDKRKLLFDFEKLMRTNDSVKKDNMEDNVITIKSNLQINEKEKSIIINGKKVEGDKYKCNNAYKSLLAFNKHSEYANNKDFGMEFHSIAREISRKHTKKKIYNYHKYGITKLSEFRSFLKTHNSGYTLHKKPIKLVLE